MTGHCTGTVLWRTGSDRELKVAELTAEQVQALIRAGVPMAEDIDLRIDRLEADLAVARVPFHGKLVRPGGTLSGPTIMSLADAAMYAVVLGRLGRVEMAVTALRRIGEAVGVITDMNLQIASAAEEQSSVADEINRNISSIRDVTEAISSQAAESAQVSQALNSLANHQQQLMDQFRV